MLRRCANVVASFAGTRANARVSSGVRIIATPETQKILRANTMELMEQTQEQFVQFIRDDLDNWGRQIKAAGIQPN